MPWQKLGSFSEVQIQLRQCMPALPIMEHHIAQYDLFLVINLIFHIQISKITYISLNKEIVTS